MAQSVFRTWTKPEDALSKIAERIEADLGDGENEAGRRGLRVASVAGLLSAGEAAYLANYLYAEKGNHWQGGRTWPVTYPTTDIRDRQLGKVAPMFCAVDVVGKAIWHQTNALLSREATIAAVPVEPVELPPEDSPGLAAATEKKARQDQEAAAGVSRLSPLWDAVQLWEQARCAARRAAWGRRGPMRVRRLPSAWETMGEGEERRDRLASGLTFEEAAARVTLSAPLPMDALIYTDRDTREVAHIIRFPAEGGDGAEVWFTENGKTCRRVLHPNKDAEDLDPEDAPLPLQEVTGPLLLTRAVREQQAQINFFRTKLGRVVQTAADRLIFAADIEDPGDWSSQPPPPGVPVKTAEDINGNTIYFHPGAWELGPEQIGLAAGRVIEGKTKDDPDQILTPQIVVVPPVDPEYITKALDAAEAALLRACGQGHTVTLNKATSGEEKKQDRAEFAKRLEAYKQSVELAVAGILTALAKAALMMTAPSDPMHAFFRDFRIVCTLHIDTGPLSAEEQKQEVELYEKRLKPRADVMAAVAGVEDAGAADTAMAADPVLRRHDLDDVLAKAAELRDTFSLGVAVAYVQESGVASPALLAALQQGDYPEPVEQ